MLRPLRLTPHPPQQVGRQRPEHLVCGCEWWQGTNKPASEETCLDLSSPLGPLAHGGNSDPSSARAPLLPGTAFCVCACMCTRVHVCTSICVRA